jgi:hypothetical protein
MGFSGEYVGAVDFVELDGPEVRVALKGRFWHPTDTVMLRIEAFVRKRIPEVVSVQLAMERSGIVDDNRLNSQRPSA